MRRHQGFTLLELLTALTLIGLLLTLGIPAFSATLDRQRLDSATGALANGLAYTRLEAVRRNRVVTMAPIGENWNTGWRIFIDSNNDGAYDEGEVLLREDTPARTAFIHANTPVARFVRYNARGESVLLNGGFQAGTFRFCPQQAGADGRVMVLNRVGRIRLAREAIDSQYCPG
jgi:type IV fimbrial biogenesis protein FimT